MSNSNTHCLSISCFRLQLVSLSLVLFISTLLLEPVVGQESSDSSPVLRPERTLFVPFDDLNVLLQENSDRVLLTRSEYDALLASSKQKVIERAPLDSIVVSTNYDGRVLDGVTVVKGKVVVEPLNDGLVQIPLSLGGAAIRSATIAGTPANLWRNKKGQLFLLLSGKERRTLDLDMMIPMETTAARQSMAFEFPVTSASQLRLTVRGNVEIKSGASVIKRVYDQGKNETLFDVLPTRGKTTLVMSLNNRLLKDDRVVVAHSVLIHKLTTQDHQLHATASFDVIHGSVEALKFEVPQGYQVSTVETELLNQWQIERNDQGQDILKVSLRIPTREDVVVNIVAAKPAGEIANWDVPQLKPVDVAGSISVVGVLSDTDLRAEQIVTQGVTHIDHEFLSQAIPSTITSEPYANPVAIVGAFYAPQTDYSVKARFSTPDPELRVASTGKLIILENELRLEGGVALTCLHDSRFDVDLLLPDGWRFTQVADESGKKIEFDRYPDSNGSRIKCRIGKKLTSQATKIYFVAKSVPQTFVGDWTEQMLSFPALSVIGATRHTGVLAVASPSDVDIRPDSVLGLNTLSEDAERALAFDTSQTPIAYSFESEDYTLNLKLARLSPLVTARTFTFFQVMPNQLLVRNEILFDIRQAKTDLLSFSLPIGTPESLSIQSQSCPIKDYSSEPQGASRKWKVQLASKTTGMIRLLIDYRMPLEESELAKLSLVPVQANDVRFQSAMVAVEGNSELDVEIKTEGRPVDVGELEEAVYRPGRYLLGAFAWTSDEGALSVAATRRPIYELPAAIVQRAEMVTSISGNGKAHSAARFELVTHQPFVQIELPEDAVLWSVLLDGKPAKPQRDRDSLILSLVSGLKSHTKNLQLVYETTTEEIEFVGSFVTEAPRLKLFGNAPSVDVPLVDMKWRVLLPDGYVVSSTNNEFQSDDLQKPSLAERFGQWLVALGGGFQQYRLMSPMTREASAQISAQSGSSTSEPVDEFEMSSKDGLRRRIASRREAVESARRNNPSSAIAGLDRGSESRDTPTSAIGSSAIGSNRRFGLDGGEMDESEDVMLEGIMDREKLDIQSETRRAGRVPAPDVSRPVPQKPSSGSLRTQTIITTNDKMRTWALQGLRSLDIQLTETDESINLVSLGEQPVLEATVSNQSKVQWLAVGCALLIGFFGVVLVNQSMGRKVGYLMIVLLTACAVPAAGASFNAFFTIADYALLATVAVGVFYVVAAIGTRIKTPLSMLIRHLPFALLAFAIVLPTQAPAQDNQRAAKSHKVIQDLGQLKALLNRLERSTSPKIPDDAIVVPFDPTDPEGRSKADRLLLPYELYQELLKRSETAQQTQPVNSPVDYVISAANYSTTLTLDEDLTLRGHLSLAVMVDEPQWISLHFQGGAISQATLDGIPAKLRFAAVEPSRNRQSKANPRAGHVVLLYVEGSGKKKFEFDFQVKPTRQGGWRSINLRLPVGMTRSVDVTSTSDPAEVRLVADADRRTIEAQANETIKSVLNRDGSFRLNWKPSTASQAINQSLTVNSDVVFDVREDGLRLAWRFDLDFRGSELDTFSFQIPNGYLVERVIGENIRSWDVRPLENWQQLVVNALSAARNRETMTVHLSKRDFQIPEDPVKLEAPYLSVEGAALQKGSYVIRRSPVIELKQLATRAANRIDKKQHQARIDMAEIASDSSPLGIMEFQVFQFVTTPFKIGLQARELVHEAKAETQCVLRLGQSEADFELNLNYQLGQRPVYELEFELPKSLLIDDVAVGEFARWTVEKDGNVQRVRVFYSKGMTGRINLLVNGKINDYTGQPKWKLPQIKVNQVQSQSGQFAIQVDPAISAKAANLVNCQGVLVRQLQGWLNPDQRGQTRQAIQYRVPEYSATLELTKIQPQVTVETVSNIRLTFFNIEETILLDFDIQRAGVRQIQFLIPNELVDAKVVAKFVRQKTISPAEGQPGYSQVKLDLQDDIIGSYRVVIENDRQLKSGDQLVPFPKVVTGTLKNQFATLQNAGRDEINVLPNKRFTKLHRELSQYNVLQDKLAGGEFTMAYVTNGDGQGEPLKFQSNLREAVETVSASIEFAKTTMVVDSSGAYRALQNFQVNNRSEQYLDIELPDGARLLTVVVRGIPVKPVQSPDGNDRVVRIPIVKTPAGDLDYPVQLKYGGRLGTLTSGKPVDFPVIETRNVNVQLSQLHLMLPESHQWMNFGGTMTRVDDKGELQEGFISYKARQIEQLVEQISKDAAKGKLKYSQDYSKRRAIGNLALLNRELEELAAENRGKQKLEGQIRSNKKVIEEAQKQARLTRSQTGYGVQPSDSPFPAVSQSQQQGQSQQSTMRYGYFDNRAAFNELVDKQNAVIARNSVTKRGKNFDVGRKAVQGQALSVPEAVVVGRDAIPQEKTQNFDGKWFARNQLSQKGRQQVGAELRKLQSGKEGESKVNQKAKTNDLVIQLGSLDFKDSDQINFVNPLAMNNSASNQVQQFAVPANQPAITGEIMRNDTAGGRAGGGGGFGGGGVNMPGFNGGLGQNSGGGFGGGQARAGISRAEQNTNLGMRAGLTSLDIELPQRGVSYYFKSPRGKATVVAHPVAKQIYMRWISLCVALGVCFVVWVGVKVWDRITIAGTGFYITAMVMLGLIGLISVVTSTLPIYGLLIFVLAALMLVERIFTLVWTHLIHE